MGNIISYQKHWKVSKDPTWQTLPSFKVQGKLFLDSELPFYPN